MVIPYSTSVECKSNEILNKTVHIIVGISPLGSKIITINQISKAFKLKQILNFGSVAKWPS